MDPNVSNPALTAPDNPSGSPQSTDPSLTAPNGLHPDQHASQHQQEPAAQQQPETPAQHDQSHHHHHGTVDENLSSIAAFNASFNSQPQLTPSLTATTNEWGKRPAEDPAGDAADANKRQHVDDGMRLIESDIAEQVQAHLAAVGQQTAGVPEEQHHHQQQQQMQQQQQHQEQAQQQHTGYEGYATNGEGVQDFQYDAEEREDEDLSAALAQAEQDAAQGWGNGIYADPGYAIWDANQNLRIQSLPILDNLSTQILQTLGKGPYQETINIVTQPESGEGQAYNTMKGLFDQTKKLYTHEAFLSADELKLEAPEQRATIRKVNLATFVSSVFGSQEVGFFHLNEHFLDTFVPDGGRLLKSQGSLYLDLKTQAYISAMSTNERTKEEILEDLFPDNMAQILLARRPGAKQLTPSEQDFVARLMHRRQHLMDDPDDENLGEKYVWQDFLKEVSWYVSKNHEMIVAQPVGQEFHRKRRSDVSGARPSFGSSQMMGHQSVSPNGDDAATAHLLHHHNSQHHSRSPSGDNAHTQMDMNTDLFGQNTSYMGAPPLAQPPIPPQTQPTQVLYERARLAATSKSSPNARRAGLPSQRRPWTTEEENALMAGLDRVKGPHWSQILAMFGPGGTVSEALKDRNQVQLKDKARNLKLFFLKSGIEVPYYLQFVTGELKTRAPGQAAKNAAKKAVEASAEEDAAHVAAVTALGNAHRSNSHGLDGFGQMPPQNGAAPPPHDMSQMQQGTVDGTQHHDIHQQYQPPPDQHHQQPLPQQQLHDPNHPQPQVQQPPHDLQAQPPQQTYEQSQPHIPTAPLPQQDQTPAPVQSQQPEQPQYTTQPDPSQQYRPHPEPQQQIDLAVGTGQVAPQAPMMGAAPTTEQTVQSVEAAVAAVGQELSQATA